MAVAELMRILLDQAKLGWDQAWDFTLRTLAYTNHTLLPEALEKWPVELFEALIPRHLEIIYEINRRFLNAGRRIPAMRHGPRISLIEETPVRKVRMANLAIVGTTARTGWRPSTPNCRQKTVPDFAAMFPECFNNKTNGVTPRRWLLLANPDLATAHRCGRRRLGHGPVAFGKNRPDGRRRGFPREFLAAKREAKVRFVDWIKARHGVILDPDTIFDMQIKRIHEYKRQLLNVLQVVSGTTAFERTRPWTSPPDVPFRRKGGPGVPPRQAHHQTDHQRRHGRQQRPGGPGKFRVEFLPNYSFTLAERLIPAATSPSRSRPPGTRPAAPAT